MIAKKYGWDDVYAGKPIGEAWFENGNILVGILLILCLWWRGDLCVVSGIEYLVFRC